MRQMSSKIRVHFFATTDLMRFCKNVLPLTLLRGLCSWTPGMLREQFVLPIMKENFEHVLRMKRAVTVIQSCLRTRKVRRAALLKRAKRHEGQMVKLQALFRAHLVRVRHAAVIKKIKTEAPKKTRKY